MRTIKTKANMEHFERLMGFIEETLQEFQVPQKTMFTMMTACDEVIVNIIQYAYPDNEGEIEIQIDRTEEDVGFFFMDDGLPFNPLSKPDVDTSLLAHEREIGGLGIHMVRKLMDKVDYVYRDGKNILTMRKTIPKNM